MPIGAAAAIAATRRNRTRRGEVSAYARNSTFDSERNAEAAWFKLPQKLRTETSKRNKNTWPRMTWSQRLEAALHSQQELSQPVQDTDSIVLELDDPSLVNDAAEIHIQHEGNTLSPVAIPLEPESAAVPRAPRGRGSLKFLLFVLLVLSVTVVVTCLVLFFRNGVRTCGDVSMVWMFGYTLITAIHVGLHYHVYSSYLREGIVYKTMHLFGTYMATGLIAVMVAFETSWCYSYLSLYILAISHSFVSVAILFIVVIVANKTPPPRAESTKGRSEDCISDT
eukprot:TRINITY_DN8923_c3_g1_i1.p1 TRINITY_DN8923_c3_g1~~TRINITY_DN8923_c3_g1_i1.p1  ORF type:complete len:281 (+),score=29.49 TRINITY_DN8923_c3_g1_i1:41-883(+)